MTARTDASHAPAPECRMLRPTAVPAGSWATRGLVLGCWCAWTCLLSLGRLSSLPNRRPGSGLLPENQFAARPASGVPQVSGRLFPERIRTPRWSAAKALLTTARRNRPTSRWRSSRRPPRSRPDSRLRHAPVRPMDTAPRSGHGGTGVEWCCNLRGMTEG
jgi:hypothetical protein